MLTPLRDSDCGAEDTELNRYKQALAEIVAAALRNNGPLARDRCEDQMRGIGYRAQCALEIERAFTEAGAKIQIRGKRGQSFLREILAALDALPEHKLIAHELVEKDGAVCALGAVSKARGVDMTGVDPENIERVADIFFISGALAREIVYKAQHLQREAEANPEAFEREHSDLAFKAYKMAEAQYTDNGRVLFRRTDLRALCRENWPAFVAQAAAAPLTSQARTPTP